MSLLSNYYSFPENLSLTELTNFTCGEYNREGRLCGNSKPGYGPAVYAFSLMWTLYLFLVLFPITVFMSLSSFSTFLLQLHHLLHLS